MVKFMGSELLPVLPPLQVAFQNKRIEMKQFIKILGCVLAIACFVAFVYLFQPKGSFICDFSSDDATEHSFNDSVFNIFQDIPIEDARVYIAVAPDDRDKLPFLQGYSNVIYSSHPDVVKEFARTAAFKMTSGDLTTVQSWLYITSGNKVVFKSPIVISSTCVGLQNNSTGWAEAQNPAALLEILALFDSLTLPIFLF